MTKLVVDKNIFPNLHELWKENPERFENFLREIAQRMWGGELEEAMKMLENWFSLEKKTSKK